MARFTTEDRDGDSVTLLTGPDLSHYAAQAPDDVTAVLEALPHDVPDDPHCLEGEAVYLTDEQRRELAAALLEGLGDG